MKNPFRKTAKTPQGWVGVSLAGGTLRLAQVQWNGQDRPRVLRCLSLELEGEVGGTLDRLRRDRGLARWPWVAMLSSGDYQTLVTDAPDVPSAELADALRWRLKDALGLAPEKSALDALLLPLAGNPAVRQRQAYVVAAETDAVARCAAPFVEAGVGLMAVDIPELAQRNLAALCETEHRGLAFLDLSRDGGQLTLNWSGELFAGRRIESGTASWEGRDEQTRQVAYDRLSLELQRSLDYFDRQFSFIPVQRLLVSLAGDAAGLVAHLGQQIYVPVERFDPASVLDLPDGVDVSNCLDVIGLALRNGEGAL